MPGRTILFDINETVLDLASLKSEFEAVFGDKGLADTWFATLLHTSTVCALTGVETGFAQLAQVALDKLAARRGVKIGDSKRTAILGCFSNLNPHADVAPALQRLRASGYTTVAFTNSSRELAKSQIANAGLAELFDEVISVEEAGAFKPAAEVYQFAARHLKEPPEDLRLVACHDWDTHGALVAGLRAAYIDRSGAPYHPLYRRPDIFAVTMEDAAKQIIDADASPQG